MSGDITDSFDMPTTSCPCGPDEYYCQLPGYGCSIVNILGKASHIISKNQPGYWNDLDMLEVGNGGMDYEENKLHFSMWAAIKSPLIMGNKLDQLSPEDYAILINPAVLAINQDPSGSAISRKLVRQVDDKDENGFGEVQVWSGGLNNSDQVVAFLNIANTSRMMTFSLVDIFGGIKTNKNAQRSWDLFDVWGNETVMSNDVASQVLNGTLAVGNATGYYNASATSWEKGLNQSESLLFGTPAGSVQAGGSISAEVPSRVKTALNSPLISEEVMPPCAHPRLTRIGCELCDSRDTSIYQLAPFPESAVAENKRCFAVRDVLDIF